MKRSTPLLLLALLSCAPAAPRPAVAPAPQVAAAQRPQRVVLLSFDGLGADALARQTGLPSFERLARESASARVIPVTPTLTGPTHAAMLTGAWPEKTGIVANRFHVPGTPQGQETRGMDLEPDVETIAEAARRQGKRVGAVPFPMFDGRTPRRSTDFGLAWSEPVTRGRTITLKRADFKREWVPPGWTPRPQRRQSFSPIMRARLEWSVPDLTRIDVDLVAYDVTDDQKENYGAVFLESGEYEAAPDAAGWFPISIQTGGALHGSWSKLLRVDPTLSEVTVYWGPVMRNHAWPASFQTLIDEEAGFWPGDPDERADPQTFIEQVQRLAEFLARSQAVAIQRMQFDLLLAYQPAIDEASHLYLGSSEAIVREAFRAADGALATVWRALHRDRDALLVTGDHGLTVREREVRMNRLLGDAGFTPQWRAFASGHVAHLYGSGNVDAVAKMLAATGYFELVQKKTAASHRNSGDIVVFAHPNTALSPSNDSPAVIPRAGGGIHGALNTHRELHTVLFATGAVPRTPMGQIEQTEIKRILASLLGLSPGARQ